MSFQEPIMAMFALTNQRAWYNLLGIDSMLMFIYSFNIHCTYVVSKLEHGRLTSTNMYVVNILRPRVVVWYSMR